jgi:hypothetical protein
MAEAGIPKGLSAENRILFEALNEVITAKFSLLTNTFKGEISAVRATVDSLVSMRSAEKKPRTAAAGTSAASKPTIPIFRNDKQWFIYMYTHNKESGAKYADLLDGIHKMQKYEQKTTEDDKLKIEAQLVYEGLKAMTNQERFNVIKADYEKYRAKVKEERGIPSEESAPSAAMASAATAVTGSAAPAASAASAAAAPAAAAAKSKPKKAPARAKAKTTNAAPVIAAKVDEEEADTEEPPAEDD